MSYHTAPLKTFSGCEERFHCFLFAPSEAILHIKLSCHSYITLDEVFDKFKLDNLLLLLFIKI